MRRHASFASALLALSATASSQDPYGELRRMVPNLGGASDVSAVGDLDGDNDADVLIGGSGGGVEVVLINDGSGRLSEVGGLLPDGELSVREMALFDLEGDGDLDAFLGAEVDVILENDGSAAMTDISWSALPSQPSSVFTDDIQFADLDGDGDIDGGTCSSVINIPNYLLRNDGGTFTYLPVGAGISSSFEFAFSDFDTDGDLDIWYLSFAVHQLWRNDGNFVLTDIANQLPPMHFGEGAVTRVHDFDADGLEDIFIATGRLKVAPNVLWKNTGGATFTNASSQLPNSWYETNAADMGDLDGDGDMDLWLGNRGSQPLVPGPNEVWLNDGAGNFIELPIPDFRDDTHKASLEDMDGDGDLDLFVSSNKADRLELNDGTGVLVDVTTGTLPYNTQDVSGSAWGDANGDGAPDLFYVRDESGTGAQNRLFLNNGAGAFEDVTDTRLPELLDYSAVAVWADLDADGDEDIAVGNTGVNGILWNDGAGVFTSDLTALAADSSNTDAILAADLMGDGRIDLLSSPSFGFDTFFLNQGGGAFAVTDLGAGNINSRAFSAGDVDGDGDTDVFSAAWVQNRILLNQGGSFLVDPVFPDSTQGEAGTFLDMDNDGDLDLVHTGLTPDLAEGGGSGEPVQARQFWRNDGTGQMADETFLVGSDPFQYSDLVLAFDADDDGWKDLLFRGGDPTFLRNNAGVDWVDGSLALPSVPFGTMSMADMDGNGAMDILAVATDQQWPMFNLGNTVAWASLPTVGKTMTMDLFGDPGAPWYLFYGTSTTSLPFAPFGTLKLNPLTPGGLLAAGAFSPGGSAQVSGPIADEPGLVGVALYWQQLAGFAPTFSNLEVTTFGTL